MTKWPFSFSFCEQRKQKGRKQDGFLQLLFYFRALVANHFQDLILVGLLEMQHQSFLEDGWVWELYFLSVVDTPRLIPLIMNPGPLGKRFVKYEIFVIFSDDDMLMFAVLSQRDKAREINKKNRRFGVTYKKTVAFTSFQKPTKNISLMVNENDPKYVRSLQCPIDIQMRFLFIN